VFCIAPPPQPRLPRQAILKLALIGFVFAEPPDGQVFISLFTISGYTHPAFSQIGFVLHNSVKMIVAFSALTADSTDEHSLYEWVMRFLTLPIFTSGHLLKTPVPSAGLRTTFCLLPSAFCLLSSVFCLLSSVFCLLSSVFCLLSSVF